MPGNRSLACPRPRPYVVFVALLGAVFAGSTFAGFPELGLVVLAGVSPIVEKGRNFFLQWWRRAATYSSIPFGGFIVCLLLLSWLCGEQRIGIMCISAICYWVIYELGRQSNGRQKLRSAQCLPDDAYDVLPKDLAQGERPKSVNLIQPKRSASGCAAGVARKSVRKPEKDKPAPSHACPLVVLHRHSVRNDLRGQLEVESLGLSFDASVRSADVETVPSVVHGLCDSFQTFIHRESATEDDQRVANNLAVIVRGQIAPIVCGEFEVRGAPCGNMSVIGQCGEHPEIDVVVSVDMPVLKESLMRHSSNTRPEKRSPSNFEGLNLDMLMRVAIRLLSDRLTGFRFWRSQFTGPEVKIVLMVPVAMGVFNYPIRMNFSINTPYPLRLAHVLNNSDLGTKELVLLVVRWADVRGIARISKGHLHQYAWSLLVIHFRRGTETDKVAVKKTTIELFAEFVRFYAEEFQRCEGPIGVSFTGKAVQQTGENMLWGIPYIEDPFECSHDAAQTLTADGVKRLKEELSRAVSILGRGQLVTFSELLEKWTPPDWP